MSMQPDQDVKVVDVERIQKENLTMLEWIAVQNSKAPSLDFDKMRREIEQKKRDDMQSDLERARQVEVSTSSTDLETTKMTIQVIENWPVDSPTKTTFHFSGSRQALRDISRIFGNRTITSMSILDA